MSYVPDSHSTNLRYSIGWKVPCMSEQEETNRSAFSEWWGHFLDHAQRPSLVRAATFLVSKKIIEHDTAEQ